jgi:glycine/D-amino acid oxidase-like deaminating enzyme
MTPPRHVIVCGAGVMGAAVAYYLARRGVAVTVVERSGVACAASGKSGGFLALDWCDSTDVGPLARLSFALHGELAREIPTDYGYRRMDTYMLAAREKGAVATGSPRRAGSTAPPSWRARSARPRRRPRSTPRSSPPP